jgi:hypothetical protein
MFALLMAASPIIGSFWVTPNLTRWLVFGVGAFMVVATAAAGLRPSKSA